MGRRGLTLRNCSQCPRLVESRTEVVRPIITSRNPSVLFISDFPSELDDAESMPMYNGGPNTAGFWHHKFLKNIGVENSYAIIHTVQCKPNGNVELDEMKNCSMWIKYLLDKFRFRLVVLYGELPMRLILDFKRPVSDYAGTFFMSSKLDNLKCFVTYHPSFLVDDKEKYLEKIKQHTKLIKKYLYY